VILDPAEAKRAAEQAQVIARVQRLTSWAKGLGFTSLGLLVVIGQSLGLSVHCRPERLSDSVEALGKHENIRAPSLWT
jgi:hypothetical protein